MQVLTWAQKRSQLLRRLSLVDQEVANRTSALEERLNAYVERMHEEEITKQAEIENDAITAAEIIAAARTPENPSPAPEEEDSLRPPHKSLASYLD